MNKRKLGWGSGITAVVWLLVSLLAFSGNLRQLEWISLDHRMQTFRAEAGLHPQIAVVLIDEPSLQAMNPLVGRFPWPRSVYADLLEFFALGGARAVVFDILFTENEQGAKDGLGISDRRLAEASEQSGIAYHAMQIFHEEVAAGEAVLLDPPLPDRFRSRFALPRAEGFGRGRNNNYTLPYPELYRASRGIGAVGIDADDDGVYRRMHLFHPYHGAVFPALSVAPLLDMLQPERVVSSADQVALGKLRLPLDREGRYLVNMAGRMDAYSIGGLFASIERIRTGDFEDLPVSPDEFAGKVVFVGASAVGLEDIKATAVSPRMPGVMVHASVASNILSGKVLHPAGRLAEAVLSLLLAAVTVAAVLWLPRLSLQLLLPLTAAALFVVWNYWRYAAGELYPLIAPLLAGAAAYLASFAYLAFTEGRDRRRVRTMLSQYVSPAMLSEVLDRYEEQLQAEVGTTERLSVLFSDVRGFTTISERLSAEEVVELLNTHFSVMSEVIFNHQGTLDKFIGDAIMAFWGAPIRLPDHANRAVRAAIEMDRSMSQVNRLLEEKGYRPLSIGIGINTGDVVLGNIGSARKLDYTVIGDSVNLASRLEGLTKRYGSPVIVSEFTRRELDATIPCAPVDLVRVKGRQEPIRIYWPMGLPEDDTAQLSETVALCERIDKAFSLYLQRDWQQALTYYEALPDIPLRDVFLVRCREYLHTPPPKEWDGVFVVTSK